MKQKNLLKSAVLGITALFAVNTANAQLTTVTYSFVGTANTHTGVISTFTVPSCVNQMTIEVQGAAGGFNGGTAGNGARMIGTFTVTPGQVLSYLVGKTPGVTTLFPGGGGGSYVASGATFSTATPMIVAGGGGGGYSGGIGTGAPVTTSGTGSNPGVNGNGAPSGACVGGGGGFFTSGGTDINYGFTGGQGFQQGGFGSQAASSYTASYQPGGFGGGTAANYVGSCNTFGGNGGGYSGGSAQTGALMYFGNAGGSFNGGTNQNNTAAFNTGHGLVIFTYNAGPVITAVSSNSAVCAGNSATLTASGVTSYTWNTGATTAVTAVTPTASTVYTVVGTSTCGVSSTTVAVNVNASPTVNVASTSSAVCAGQSVSLTASGSANTYSWNTGATTASINATPSVTTIYSVVGTSTANGCTKTTTASITVNPNPTITVNSGAICAGQSFTMVPSGAGTYTYSNGSAVATPTANASYTVTGTSTLGCVGNAAISTVTVNALPTVTASSSNSGSICAGQSVSLTASGAATYSWNTGATTAVIAVSPSVTTTYTVGGLSINGCANVATITQNVNSCVGIQSIANQSSAISVYPNPSTGIFTVEFANGLNKTINVTDITGRVVLTTTSTADKVNVNISTLSNGIYYIKVISNTNTEVIKIVKQ